ncbi:hypothetical protein Poly41_70410 [Novipirellula artificiosorum]|uniref:Uncharacterized protein n=1 Tax=Novipirellula artificiosorum TaxID=2528016 RepID=A0A5C6CTV5_9BACT|nr:hypothetical protein Poly41_70410 [Novipirellula artificiosorum]
MTSILGWQSGNIRCIRDLTYQGRYSVERWRQIVVREDDQRGLQELLVLGSYRYQ